MSHTPEPWVIEPYKYANDAAHIIGADGKKVSYVDCEYYNNIKMEDNRRIVACVNACAGVTDGDLQQIAQDGGWQAISEQWKKQRDELLNLLSHCEQMLEEKLPVTSQHLLEEIAKARGQHER